MKKQDLIKQAQIFLQLIFDKLSQTSLSIPPHWDIDHLCYRVNSLEQYEYMKTVMASWGSLLVESDVNGRPIASYLLQEPITFRNYMIDVIELPAPKPGKVTQEGFEHLEMVCDEDFTLLQKQFPDCLWNPKGLRKLFNKELELQLEHGCIKFHHLSLESVIRLEKQQNIYEPLVESNILEILDSLCPFIAGTIPLGIDTEESDLDILIDGRDSSLVHKTLIQLESKFHLVKQTSTQHQKLDSEVRQYQLHKTNLEIFSQPIHPTKQRAFLHFQAEEKLLKYGRSFLPEEIKKLKNKGIKTEPAFSQVLGLQGSPYEEMERIQKIPIKELRTILVS